MAGAVPVHPNERGRAGDDHEHLRSCDHADVHGVTVTTLVRSILEHATDYPWRAQGIGVLGLWLDDQREYRLHVWDPDGAVDDPPIHDHPWDFTSTVIVGELVNSRYVEDPDGREYLRERYPPGDETDRRVDTVRLMGTPETLRAGDSYHQVAHELHDSRQVPGTVTVVRFEHAVDDQRELTLCRRPNTPWVSGHARAATQDEMNRITTAALALFDAPQHGVEELDASRLAIDAPELPIRLPGLGRGILGERPRTTGAS